jgi:hypothetical protein
MCVLESKGNTSDLGGKNRQVWQPTVAEKISMAPETGVAGRIREEVTNISSDSRTVFAASFIESLCAAKCSMEAEEVTNTLQLAADLTRRFELPSDASCSSLCKM